MKKASILSNINSNGGFDNFNNWNHKEVSQWVKATFDCSNAVASSVAYELLFS